MERPKLPPEFDMHSPAWRSIVLVVMFTGLSLWFASLPKVNASPPIVSARTARVGLTQTPSQVLAANEEPAKPELEGDPARERQIRQRLMTVAITAAVLLMLLTFGYGYLRLELTTRGFYSGRLQIAAGIASLSVITCAYFLWRWLTVWNA